MTDRDERWRVWGRRPDYGDLLRRRATGELPEMESAVAAADQVANVLGSGEHILDVGAGAGHYLRSLKSRLREPFSYTGVDSTLAYVRLAADAWRGEPRVRFVAGDIYALPFKDRAADVVLCCNVFLHLPSIAAPLRELVRVARRYVLVRTLVGDRGFRVQEIEGDAIAENGEPANYNWYNIYPRTYVERIVASHPRVRAVRIIEDRAFDPRRLEIAGRDSNAANATRVVGDWQVNGYILQPWQFVLAELKES